MKKLLLLLLSFPALAFAQNEQKINAPITRVTVFTSAAQIEHVKSSSLQRGRQVVVFEKLTDFVDPTSIQLKSSDNATILSVRTRKNFEDKAIATKEVDAMNTKRKELEKQERKLRDEYEVLLADEELLEKNNYLGSQQQTVKISELKEASTFYHSRLTEIYARKSVLEDEIEEVIRAVNKIEQEINTRRSLPVKNYTEIEVELDVTQSGNTDFLFTYITPNASWKPYYDMRSNGIGAPVMLEAKGLVTQNTGADWNNVDLVLSTNDPYDNSQEPKIDMWRLDYYTPVPRKQSTARTVGAYDFSGETVHGIVLDAKSGDPLPFAKIVMSNNPQQVETTDVNGYYSFRVPRGETAVNVSYLGYTSAYVPINQVYTKVLLQPEQVNLDEVIITSARSKKKVQRMYDRLENVSEAEIMGDVAPAPIVEYQQYSYSATSAGAAGTMGFFANSYALSAPVEKDLRMEFPISTPFTIPSDNADHRVAIATYNLNATYEYHAVPKLDPSTYLVAQVSGWEKLNLLNGESNLYFDGTLIGKTYVDVNSAKDTISFSLGKDKKIVVERTRSEEKSKTRVLGSRNKYEVQWDFTVRNNGGASIPFVLKDHFPVSVNSDIKVKQGSHEGASPDENTGILTWKFILNKGETKKVSFDYSVDYGNNGPIFLE
jgi:hypothetical protein